MPKELGEREYEILDYIPYKVRKQILMSLPSDINAKNVDEAEERMQEIPLAEQDELGEILLKGLVKPTPDLESDDCHWEDMTILLQIIMEDLDLSADRIGELRKKVVKL